MVFSIPEYAYKDQDTGRGVFPNQIKWTKISNTKYSFNWSASNQTKIKQAIDFNGYIQLKHNILHFELNAKNPSQTQWDLNDGSYRAHLLCLSFGKIPNFHDPEGLSTFIRNQNKWVSVSEDINGNMPPRKSLTKLSHEISSNNIVVKTNNKNNLAVGIYGNPSTHLSYCFVDRVSCIHVNPLWDALKPNASQQMKGKIYFSHNGLIPLWEKHLDPTIELQ